MLGCHWSQTWDRRWVLSPHSFFISCIRRVTRPGTVWPLKYFSNLPLLPSKTWLSLSLFHGFHDAILWPFHAYCAYWPKQLVSTRTCHSLTWNSPIDGSYLLKSKLSEWHTVHPVHLSRIVTLSAQHSAHLRLPFTYCSCSDDLVFSLPPPLIFEGSLMLPVSAWNRARHCLPLSIILFSQSCACSFYCIHHAFGSFIYKVSSHTRLFSLRHTSCIPIT